MNWPTIYLLTLNLESSSISKSTNSTRKRRFLQDRSNAEIAYAVLDEAEVEDLYVARLIQHLPSHCNQFLRERGVLKEQEEEEDYFHFEVGEDMLEF